MKDHGIEQLKNGFFCSDRYPDADALTFGEVLMLERIHDLVDDIDFEEAWAIIQKVNYLSLDDLKLYLDICSKPCI